MSQRHELVQHSQSLADIDELLAALKSLALVESRRIAGFVQAQHEATHIVEQAFVDFATDHAHHLPRFDQADEVLCLIGSERGLCGTLNQRLLAQAAPLRDSAHLVLVGAQLGNAWSGPRAQRVSGANFSHDVGHVLLRLLATLAPLLAPPRHPTRLGLRLLYLDDQGLVQRRLLPAPLPPATPAARSHPVMLRLPPEAYLHALLQEWLSMAVASALYEALLHENQQRLEHMEQARQRISDRRNELDSQANRARQEEITQEIELILLAAQAD